MEIKSNLHSQKGSDEYLNASDYINDSLLAFSR